MPFSHHSIMPCSCCEHMTADTLRFCCDCKHHVPQKYVIWRCCYHCVQIGRRFFQALTSTECQRCIVSALVDVAVSAGDHQSTATASASAAAAAAAAAAVLCLKQVHAGAHGDYTTYSHQTFLWPRVSYTRKQSFVTKFWQDHIIRWHRIDPPLKKRRFETNRQLASIYSLKPKCPMPINHSKCQLLWHTI